MPIVKRGEENRMEYRGITIMASAYKIYAMTLTERLKEKIERGEIILHSLIKRDSERGWNHR